MIEALYHLLPYVGLFISISLSLIALFTGLSGRGLLSVAFGSISCILAFLVLDGFFMVIAIALALIFMTPAMNISEISRNPLSRVHFGGTIMSFLVLFLILAIIVVHAVFPIIQSIEKETSYESMFPTNDPVFSGIIYAESQNLGSLSPACVIIKGKIIDKNTFIFIKNFEEKIRDKIDYEYVVNVISIVDILYPDGKIPNSEEKIRADIDNLPKNVRRFFLADDSKTTVIYITTTAGGTPDSSKELRKRIESCINEEEIPPYVDVIFTGVPLMSERLDRLISDSQIIVTVLSIGLLMLYLSVYTSRYEITIRPSVAISILLPLAFSILLTFDVIWLQRRYINITIPFLLTLIFGVGIDDTIHLFKRINDLIHEERLELETAIKKALTQTGGAAFATSATTIIAISTLSLVPIPVLKEFAPIGIIGMTLTFIDSMVIAPYVFKLSYEYPRILSFIVLIVSITGLLGVLVLHHPLLTAGGIYTYLTLGIIIIVSALEFVYSNDRYRI